MGWNNRLGLLTDEDYDGYVEAVIDRADMERDREAVEGSSEPDEYIPICGV